MKFTTYSDGIKTAHALQWAGTLSDRPANAKFYSYTETAGNSLVWVWFDTQGREIRRDAFGLNGNKTLVETEYNAKGQVYRITEPYFENTSKTYAATYSYDRFGRDSTVATPFGTTAYTYSGLTTTVTSPLGTNSTTINSAGWVVGETTNRKSVQFTHYTSDHLKTATPQDELPISLEYGLQGNRNKLTDPDTRVITSVYDGWGQSVRQSQKVHLTGDSIVTTYNYHASGLLQNRIRYGETTAYIYNGLNRLSSISIAGRHVQNFVYDPYDRLTQVTETVDGSKSFVSKTEYDLFGCVSKETYPGGYFT